MHVRTPVTSILWDVLGFLCTTVNQKKSEMLCPQLPAKLVFKLVCPGKYPTYMRSYRDGTQRLTCRAAVKKLNNCKVTVSHYALLCSFCSCQVSLSGIVKSWESLEKMVVEVVVEAVVEVVVEVVVEPVVVEQVVVEQVVAELEVVGEVVAVETVEPMVVE